MCVSYIFTKVLCIHSHTCLLKLEWCRVCVTLAPIADDILRQYKWKGPNWDHELINRRWFTWLVCACFTNPHTLDEYGLVECSLAGGYFLSQLSTLGHFPCLAETSVNLVQIKTNCRLWQFLGHWSMFSSKIKRFLIIRSSSN